MEEGRTRHFNNFLYGFPLDADQNTAYVEQVKQKYYQDKERLDQRGFHDIRPIFIRTNVCSKASGSCYLSQNNTSVLCSVFGPKPLGRQTARETHKSVEKGSLRFEVTFSRLFQQVSTYNQDSLTKNKTQLSTRDAFSENEEQRLASCLAETFQSIVLFEYLPYTSVNVDLTVIFNEGGLTSAAINCVSVALADAGIPLKDTCVSITLALLSKPPQVTRETNHPKLPTHQNPSQEDKPKENITPTNPFIDPNDFFILLDPTYRELHLFFTNPLQSLSAESLKDQTTCCLFYLALCPTDSTVAFLDVHGAFHTDHLNTILGPAQHACCRIASEFHQQLRHQLNSRSKAHHTETVLVNQLLERIEPSPDVAS